MRLLVICATLFPNARSLFTVQEGHGGPEEQGLNLFLALYAAYDLIEYLASAQPVDIDRAREAAQKGLMRLKPEEPDIIRVESPTRARGY